VRSVLLEQLFDYAGVFPPAALPVAEAEAEYRQAVASEHGWVLGPMLALASQRDELVDPGRVGLIADAPIDPAAGPLTQVEAKVTGDSAAARIAELQQLAPIVYVESTLSGDLSFLDAVAAARAAGADARAKIRTGGATAASFPSPDEVTGFILACVARALPFKATAGLHHPVRQQSAVPHATEHGFLNMLAATRAAIAGDRDAVRGALIASEIAAFDVPTATWRGVGADVDPAQVRATFTSIGSCSFYEPTGYLRDLGML
jgi:hypothetical protein